MSKKWIIFDAITQIKSQPLNKEQLQASIYRIHNSELKRFHIWTVGWSNWQSLENFLNSDQSNFFRTVEEAKIASARNVNDDTLEITKTSANGKKSKRSKDKTKEKSITKSMTLIKFTDEITETSYKFGQQAFDGEDMTWSGSEPPNDISYEHLKNTSYHHRSRRHELKIEVLLISNKGKTFRSHSKNISLSGSLLEDNIPFDYYDTSFDVVVVNRYAENPANSRVQLKAKVIGDGLTSRIQFDKPSDGQKSRLKILLEEYIEKQSDKKAG